MSSSDQIQQKAQQILDSNLYLTIAVADEHGEPWIANLYYAVADDGTFYWYSSKETRHSKLIARNPKVALSIFNSTATGDSVDALYIQANAYEVTDKLELVKGLRVYASKMLKTKFADKQAATRFQEQYQDFQAASKLRLYKAIPAKTWKCGPTEVYNEKFMDSRVEVG
jgi:uncharacterized protein YhbP (UPF0306 family)